MNKKILKKATLILILIVIFVAIVFIINNISDKSQGLLVGNANSNGELSTSFGEIVDFDNMIEITDNYFIQQTNDVFFNTDEYIGKSIKIEGFVYSYEDYETGNICHSVIRNTPGCCGADGLAGLDIRYDKKYPAENTWVEVIGVIGTDTVFGDTIPVIHVASITKKDEGTTFVSN